MSLKGYVGELGCDIYTIIYQMLLTWSIVGGCGMAFFRFMCLRDTSMTPAMRSGLVRKILICEYLVYPLAFGPLLYVVLMGNGKWEIVAVYR